MLINAHILHADEQLNIAMQLAKRLPDSIDKNLLICALHGVQAELFMMSVDYEKITTENTQLHRQLYEPIVQAQAARKCKYIDEDALAKTGTYSYNEFEKKLEQACQGTAKSLGEFLRKYERIGYLDFHGDSKRCIYEYLQAYFPEMRKYGPKHFSENF